MKPFSFRLDGVLNYRRYREKKAQKDLSLARRELMEKRNAARELAERRMEMAKKCSDEGFSGMAVPLYRIYKGFMKRLEQDLENTITELEEGEGKVMAQEAVLRKESVKKKMLETLKDELFQKHLDTLESEGQKALDEIVLLGKGGWA